MKVSGINQKEMVASIAIRNLRTDLYKHCGGSIFPEIHEMREAKTRCSSQLAIKKDWGAPSILK